VTWGGEGGLEKYPCRYTCAKTIYPEGGKGCSKEKRSLSSVVPPGEEGAEPVAAVSGYT